jgi:NAD(P)-dependent dehydrogenase (short-subunit alcohol dehydrogenase family)
MTLVPGSAFVTGGGSWIGRAIAAVLAAAWAPVAVFDLLPSGARRRAGSRPARTALSSRVTRAVADVDGAVAAAVGRPAPSRSW